MVARWGAYEPPPRISSFSINFGHGSSGPRDAGKVLHILETATDGDGRFDESQVFVDQLVLPRAILPVADMMAMVAPVGLFLGRLANFVNAELWGRQTTLPWGVAFPGDAAQLCPGVVGICARHPSQIYEAILEGLILGTILLWAVWRADWLKTPGRVTGLFLAFYGLARFAVEFVRQPDAQFVTAGNPLGLAWQINGWGLTQGQALSLPMIAAGLYLIRRR